MTGTLNARDKNGPQCVVTYKKTSHAKSADDGQGWSETDVNDTLNIFDNGETRTPTIVLENHPADSRVKICKDGIFQTLSSRMGTGGNNVPMVIENQEPVLLESTHGHATIKEDGVSTTLVESMEKGNGFVPMVTESINGETAGTLDSNYYKGCGERQGTEREVVLESQYDNLVVRRLTPLECSRLQGLPDGWLDIGDWVDENGKKHKDSDSPKYKMAGNGIALPFWEWLMIRIGEQLRKDGVEHPTMASLFAGSGSFELIAKRNGIEPKWNSEIEPYAVALLKQRFGDGENPGDIEKFL